MKILVKFYFICIATLLSNTVVNAQFTEFGDVTSYSVTMNINQLSFDGTTACFDITIKNARNHHRRRAIFSIRNH